MGDWLEVILYGIFGYVWVAAQVSDNLRNQGYDPAPNFLCSLFWPIIALKKFIWFIGRGIWAICSGNVTEKVLENAKKKKEVLKIKETQIPDLARQEALCSSPKEIIENIESEVRQQRLREQQMQMKDSDQRGRSI